MEYIRLQCLPKTVLSPSISIGKRPIQARRMVLHPIDIIPMVTLCVFGAKHNVTHNQPFH